MGKIYLCFQNSESSLMGSLWDRDKLIPKNWISFKVKSCTKKLSYYATELETNKIVVFRVAGSANLESLRGIWCWSNTILISSQHAAALGKINIWEIGPTVWAQYKSVSQYCLAWKSELLCFRLMYQVHLKSLLVFYVTNLSFR